MKHKTQIENNNRFVIKFNDFDPEKIEEAGEDEFDYCSVNSVPGYFKGLTENGHILFTRYIKEAGIIEGAMPAYLLAAYIEVVHGSEGFGTPDVILYKKEIKNVKKGKAVWDLLK